MKKIAKTLIGDVDSFVLVSVFLFVCFFAVMSLTTGCTEVIHLDHECEDTETGYLSNDYCEGNILVTEREDIECRFGCYDFGKETRCLKPCEMNPCSVPWSICESNIILIEFEQSACIVTENGDSYKCVDRISTRQLCECINSTHNREAYCKWESDTDTETSTGTDTSQDKPSDYYDH